MSQIWIQIYHFYAKFLPNNVFLRRHIWNIMPYIVLADTSSTTFWQPWKLLFKGCPTCNLTFSTLSFYPWIWTCPLMQKGVPIWNKKNRMANSVDLNESAYHEASHLDLHCLQKYLSWYTGLKAFWHYLALHSITKTRLFKYIENFTTKNENFQIKHSNIFHISAQNIDCEYLLEPPQRGGSNEYPQSMFLSRNKKNEVYTCKPQFYYVKMGFKGVEII